MRHVILDCDPGIDDALAIVLALNSKKLDVKGITTVFGNSTVEQTAKNALRILDYVKTSLPVFKGSGSPLVLKKSVDATDVFGKDALGDVTLPYSHLTAQEDATRFIIDSVKSGEVDTIVATGPLTNIARAFKEDNDAMSTLKSLIIMGGAIYQPGNIDRFSEFNFYCDPHAANYVLQQQVEKVLIPLDATYKVILTPKVAAGLDNKRTKPLYDMIRVVQRFDTRMHGINGTHLHDPLAVGYAIDSSFVQTKKLDVLVETDGLFTRGMCVAERRAGENAKRARPNVDVGLGVKSRGFLKYFMETVSKT